MLFSHRIDAETCNLPDTCLADTHNLPATCPEETSDLPNNKPATSQAETSDLPNRNLPPVNRTINLNHNL